MMQKVFFLLTTFIAVVLQLKAENPAATAPELAPPPLTSLYDITLKTIGGIPFPLSAFKGRVILLVNIVTKGPNSEQIGELQKLYESLVEEGLSVIAFPSNDFIYFSEMTPDEIKEVCYKTYGVQFPVTSITNVTGANKSPIYRYLTNTEKNPIYGLEVTWNFVKFLISKDGEVVNRFSTVTKPNDERIKQAIMKELRKKASTKAQ